MRTQSKRCARALSVLGEGVYKLLRPNHQQRSCGCISNGYKVDGRVFILHGKRIPAVLCSSTIWDILRMSAPLRMSWGHAIYSSYSKDNQESIYAEPIIFTQEVASTTNELLYYSYMMEHAATEDERMFYLENMLSMFSGTFFLQALYAEFEDAMYQTVESGRSSGCRGA